jgi:hypothetical protein
VALVGFAHLFGGGVAHRVGHCSVIHIPVLQEYEKAQTGARPGDVFFDARFAYLPAQSFVGSIGGGQFKDLLAATGLLLLPL